MASPLITASALSRAFACPASVVTAFKAAKG